MNKGEREGRENGLTRGASLIGLPSSSNSGLTLTAAAFLGLIGVTCSSTPSIPACSSSPSSALIAELPASTSASAPALAFRFLGVFYMITKEKREERESGREN